MKPETKRASDLYDRLHDIIELELDQTVVATALSLLLLDYCKRQANPEMTAGSMLAVFGYLIEHYDSVPPVGMKMH
jgi:hypothetical protein